MMIIPTDVRAYQYTGHYTFTLPEELGHYSFTLAEQVTKANWGEQLDENVSGLLQRLRRGTYCPSPARITEIPKEDGSSRPLAISCVEDKVVQCSILAEYVWGH